MLSARLLRIVRGGVRAPDTVIEDACQVAWSRLVVHRHRVRRETALNWLTTTAVHEALKLVRRSARELSLETAIEQGVDLPSRGGHAPDALAEHHERLRSLTSLPPRQQQVMWLYGLGLSYEEISRRQGCSSRAVERQLQRARATLRLDETAAISVGFDYAPSGDASRSRAVDLGR